MSASLNPNSVIIKGGADDTKSAFFKEMDRLSNTFDPNDKKYDALRDPEDSISSISLIKSVCLISKNVNDEITAGSIMLELHRLMVRSIRADNKLDKVNLNSILFGTVMQTVKSCVESIVSDRTDEHGYYRSVILYNIASLMDIYEISTDTKDAIKLSAFINYFVDAFTKTSK